MPQTILYYPNINILDGAWLRNAILYWDEVSSIVPYENYEDLSPELSYLQDKGVYTAIFPQDLFFSAFAESFCDAIVKRITAYDQSIAKGHDAGRAKQVRIHKKKIYAPALHKLIHCKKLPSSLMSFFTEKRFINDYDTDGWMEIDSNIANIYMRTLAEYSIKCSNKDIVLGTDTATHNREIYNSARNRTNLQTQCCKISIENFLPQPSMDVSYEDILLFKTRRKDELCAFKEKIRELETNIYCANSLELIKHYESQFKDRWQQCSKDFYRVLTEARVSFILSSLVSLVAIPFVGQLLSPHIGSDLTSAIQTGAPLLQIGISHIDYKNKISPVKSEGGFSYIIKANKEGIIHL